MKNFAVIIFLFSILLIVGIADLVLFDYIGIINIKPYIPAILRRYKVVQDYVEMSELLHKTPEEKFRELVKRQEKLYKEKLKKLREFENKLIKEREFLKEKESKLREREQALADRERKLNELEKNLKALQNELINEKEAFQKLALSLKKVDPPKAADILVRLNPVKSKKLLMLVDSKTVAQILNSLPATYAVRLFK